MTLRPRLVLALLPLLFGAFSLASAQETPFRPASVPVQEPPSRDFELIRNALRFTPEVRAVQRVRNAVVNIHTERKVASKEVKDPRWGPTFVPVSGMGTGVIIDPRGYVVTCYHVVDDVISVRCRLSDQTSHHAVVVARDPENDLALIKIDADTPLPVVPLGTASDLMIGETVLAIGNAFGYEHTASRGIVSALKRDVNLNEKMSYRALIQTDAPINPGNSGGPLINIYGEMVGVNVAIRAGAQNIGFAIPVETMIRSTTDMMRSLRRAQDGIATQDRLEETPNGLARSVVLEHIDKNSPASAAGLQRGDVLVQMGDVHVACTYDVERAFLDRKTGEHIPLVVRRQDKEEHLELVLAPVIPVSAAVAASDMIWARLGVRLSPVAADQVARANKQLHGGLEVIDISTDGPASKAGIKLGDVIVGLHSWETVSLDNVTFVLNHPDLPTFTPLSFYILRSGQVRRGYVQKVN